MSSARRSYQGAAFLSGGFRPFFFFGSLYAGLTILLWLPQFYDELELASRFAPVDWHVHELYFGFLPAIITGFLFTAVPNWTGRMPVRGMPLLLLLLVWIAGRLAVSFSNLLDWRVVMMIDVSFLALVAAVIANEITAGKNWRNLKVLMPVILLIGANIGFHMEVQFDGASDYSRRAAASAVILLIMIIGGRVIPSFTRNWLNRENPGRLPVPFSRFDAVAILIGFVAMTSWVIAPEARATGGGMVIASAAHFARLARWAGDRTLRDSLVFILHVSYFYVPLGFALIAAAVWLGDAIPQAAGIHALGVGAVGGMTLSVMARASLGHTERPLHAGGAAKLLFLAVNGAAAARILAGLDIGPQDMLIHAAGLFWMVAFIGFGVLFSRALLLPQSRTA
ncbi:NnrS family protein [Anderseniella sp. Alg231-50]|uniref:NnrS family protein n=1 Tax=Anderseniella sp. Alg231-50 TaxID=1922226 RepID=UPI000D55017A